MKRKIISRKNFYQSIKLLITLSLGLAILRAIYDKNWLVLFISIAVLVLTIIPILIRKKYAGRIPLEIEIIAILFIYASLFLGEVHNFYEKFAWWDVLLHSFSAIVFGFIGFTILYYMYSKQTVNAKPLVIAIFSFTFAIAIGAIWEIFEFAMDISFGLNMQKSGLIDTMSDLIVDTLGAIASSSIAFLYFKTKKTFIFDNLIKHPE